MTQKEMLLILSYLINNEIRLESEKRQLQYNIRYREVTDIDLTELLVATARLDTFREVSKNIRLLLNIPDDKYEEILSLLMGKL